MSQSANIATGYDKWEHPFCPKCHESSSHTYNGVYDDGRKKHRQYICGWCKEQFYEDRVTKNGNSILVPKGRFEEIARRYTLDKGEADD